jgi:hypothetical protein
MAASEALRTVIEPIGGPGSLTDRARGKGADSRFKNNAHIHLPPTFSAFDSVPQAVEMVADQGVVVLGASNYCDYRVYKDLAEQAAAKVFPLFGIEVIALLEDLGRTYLCLDDANHGACRRALGE